MVGPAVKRLYNSGKRSNTLGHEWRSESKSQKVTAQQWYDQYMAMAAESMIAGDRIAAEYLYQHAEHYWRVRNEL